jgi:signal transduction histidine kinase
MLLYVGQADKEHKPLGLRKLLQDNRGYYESLALPGARLAMSPSDRGACMVKGDAGQLSELVVHLLKNGYESLSGNPGTVTVDLSSIDVSEDELKRSYVIEKPPSGRYVCLTVSDTGEGMNDETLQRLFEPYYSTRFTGRGLGLAAVLGIVRLHGGAVFVDSQSGNGSSVRVLLPAIE